MDCNPKCLGLPVRFPGGVQAPPPNVAPPGLDATYTLNDSGLDSTFTTDNSGYNTSSAWNSTLIPDLDQTPQRQWPTNTGGDGSSPPGYHPSQKTEFATPPPAMNSTFVRGPTPPGTWRQQEAMTPGRTPLASSTPNHERSVMEDTIENMGIMHHYQDNLEAVGVIRPDPHQHLDFSGSQTLNTSDFDEYTATAGQYADEMSTALARESQMSVFDPEELNLTMAPADNNFDARRAQIINSLSRNIESMEEYENSILHAALENYHTQLDHEVSQRMNNTV